MEQAGSEQRQQHRADHRGRGPAEGDRGDGRDDNCCRPRDQRAGRAVVDRGEMLGDKHRTARQGPDFHRPCGPSPECRRHARIIVVPAPADASVLPRTPWRIHVHASAGVPQTTRWCVFLTVALSTTRRCPCPQFPRVGGHDEVTLAAITATLFAALASTSASASTVPATTEPPEPELDMAGNEMETTPVEPIDADRHLRPRPRPPAGSGAPTLHRGGRGGVGRCDHHRGHHREPRFDPAVERWRLRHHPDTDTNARHDGRHHLRRALAAVPGAGRRSGRPSRHVRRRPT